MIGMVFVRAMEMSIYKSPLEDDICPKCGKRGCKCDPETCDCEPPIEEAILNVHDNNKNKELIQDFEE